MICDDCGRVFETKGSLERHRDKKHSLKTGHDLSKGFEKDLQKSFDCEYCDLKFSTEISMHNHVKKTHTLTLVYPVEEGKPECKIMHRKHRHSEWCTKTHMKLRPKRMRFQVEGLKEEEVKKVEKKDTMDSYNCCLSNKFFFGVFAILFDHDV